MLLAVLLTASWSVQAQQATEPDPPFSTSDSNVGYIDSAIPATQFRFRFDAAYDKRVPDRAEFFYRAAMRPGGGIPPTAETGVDYQDIVPYLELGITDRLSFFVEAPVRFLNPELNANTAGVSDIQPGVKYVLWTQLDELLTFQLRTYAPTGDADRRLGTDHASLEPGLLYLRRVDDRLNIEGELKVWVPLDPSKTVTGEDFAGEILRYGIGAGYLLNPCCECCCNSRGDCGASRVTGVVEFVGWSILDGFGTVADAAGVSQQDVSGDTIVNAMFGIRWSNPGSSVFLSYGRALTGDVWYEDLLRAEYVIRF
jgi:hypothetical protein